MIEFDNPKTIDDVVKKVRICYEEMKKRITLKARQK